MTNQTITQREAARLADADGRQITVERIRRIRAERDTILLPGGSKLAAPRARGLVVLTY